MVASQEEKQQVEAVIQAWVSSFAVADMDGVKAQWDQDYPQLIYIAEDVNDPMTDWASISQFYDAIPPNVESMDWKIDNLMVDVIGDAAYAYCTFLVRAKVKRTDDVLVAKGGSEVKRIDHALVADGRDTFILRKTGSRWKIIHYHESLSRDHSHEMWGFLWS